MTRHDPAALAALRRLLAAAAAASVAVLPLAACDDTGAETDAEDSDEDREGY